MSDKLTYLKEFRKLECLSQLIAEFGGAYAETAALGVTEEEDAWSHQRVMVMNDEAHHVWDPDSAWNEGGG